jgi:hypothetical protein
MIMKKALIYSFVLFVALLATSCFKEIDITYDENKFVEFEDAVRRTPAAGVTYPIIALTRTSGSYTALVNLAGGQLKESQEMTVSIDTAIAPLLNATTIRAVEGTHFNLSGGKFTFKADTSFSTYRLNVLNPGANTGRSALLVLKLDGSSTVKPAENYRRVGFRINLN